MFRYLVRRVGVDEAESLLGDVFRVAFEKRATYDGERPNARPWLYGIATNLLAHHRRSEGAAYRRDRAAARRAQPPGDDPADQVVDRLDAEALWPHVADAVARLPEGERDALLLFVWEELSYDEIAAALDVPVGTVRSRLNRGRAEFARTPSRRSGENRERRLRPAAGAAARPGAARRSGRTHRLRPREGAADVDDRRDARESGARDYPQMPDIYPRLAYEDERAALEYLTRVFQLEEIREARTETDESMLVLAARRRRRGDDRPRRTPRSTASTARAPSATRPCR